MTVEKRKLCYSHAAGALLCGGETREKGDGEVRRLQVSNHEMHRSLSLSLSLSLLLHERKLYKCSLFVSKQASGKQCIHVAVSNE